MKKVVMIVGVTLLVCAMALGLTGVIAAQEPEETTPSTESVAGRAWGHIRDGAEVVSQAVQDLLGLTRAEIHAQRVEGKTLSEIAAEQGVSEDGLIDAIVAERTELIEQAVADGELTQEQADWLIARAKALAPFQVTNPFSPGEMGRGAGRLMGHGPRGGEFGRGLCPCPEATPEATPGTTS